MTGLRQVLHTAHLIWAGRPRGIAGVSGGRMRGGLNKASNMSLSVAKGSVLQQEVSKPVLNEKFAEQGEISVSVAAHTIKRRVVRGAPLRHFINLAQIKHAASYAAQCKLWALLVMCDQGEIRAQSVEEEGLTPSWFAASRSGTATFYSIRRRRLRVLQNNDALSPLESQSHLHTHFPPLEAPAFLVMELVLDREGSGGSPYENSIS